MSPHDILKRFFSFLAHIESLTQIVNYCLYIISLAALSHSVQGNFSFPSRSYHKFDYQERTAYFFHVFCHPLIRLEIKGLQLSLFACVILRLPQTSDKEG